MHLHVSCISIGQHRASSHLLVFFDAAPPLVPLSACLGYLKLSLAPVPPLSLSSLSLLLLLSRFVFLLFKLFQLNPFSVVLLICPSPKDKADQRKAPDTPPVALLPHHSFLQLS
ncbi:hypothetical protein H0G86_001156 [Trichoderma simmonsii]|uniref:Uncharacterized protein n=1 Tax=Trichoderma simmonsii TaxID=1491479 RepID=A0A8G0L117_9HYPO|nr:hypothetical protein H0G86_001156 [Trichoderma simmonsii]